MKPVEGRCACGALAVRLAAPPLFVHACHCTRCQRQTGSAFAHHVMIETDQLQLLQGQPVFTRLPTDSGRRHWSAGCADCRTVLWNAHGSRTPLVVYLRVGTLDTPSDWPPRAHIYVRSKPAWLMLDPTVPQFSSAYDARRIWPAASLERYDRAVTNRARRPGPSRRPAADSAAVMSVAAAPARKSRRGGFT